MSTLTKNTATQSIGTQLPPANCRLGGYLAGEAIARGDACYIKSDGLIWRCNGTAATAPARFRGIAATKAAVGEATTLLNNCSFEYGSGLTPGADYYVSATAGALDTAPTTGGTIAVAFALTATKIFILPLS